jgi:hypothetical protein
MKRHVVLGLLGLLTCAPTLHAQVAVSAIDQSRLLKQPQPAAPTAVDENGNALAASDEVADDSFGAQVILKDQPHVPTFAINAGGSLYYTSNVALTRHDTKDDTFAILNANGSWTHRLQPELECLVGLQVSTFRYNRTSELDFNDIDATLGLSWTPQRWPGVSIFGRYDFTELIDRHGSEILRDHEFSLGAQKVFVLGRAHAITLGLLGMAGISTPHAAQRDQIGLFAGYHLQLARNLATDILYHPAGQFYNSGGRNDFNQVVTWSLSLRLGQWSEAAAYFSFGSNRSSEPVFDYDVTTTGGGLGFSARF